MGSAVSSLCLIRSRLIPIDIHSKNFLLQNKARQKREALETRMSFLVLEKMAENFTHCEEEVVISTAWKLARTAKIKLHGSQQCNLKNIWWTKHHFKDLNRPCICRGTDKWRWKLKKPCQGGVPCRSTEILKRVVSVFINASCRCPKLNENSLSLSEF